MSKFKQKIAIHSAPRSGSTWLGEIFNSSPKTTYKFQPLFSYAFKNYLTPTSSTKDINNFFLEIEKSDDKFLNQIDQKDNGSSPIFKKNIHQQFIVYKEVRYHNILEHLLATDSEMILVGLIRNPLSVISSWLRAPKEFRADLGWNESSEWRYAELKNQGMPEEFNGYEKWKETANIFHKLKKKFPGRVYIINYQKLLENTLTEVQGVFDFCGIPTEDQTLKFIRQSSTSTNNDAYSVYRCNQSDDKWKTQLNPEIAKQIIDDLRDSELAVYLNIPNLLS